MIKKFLLAIFFILVFTQVTFADVRTSQDTFKVTSVNFDTSNSVIFLTSPDNTPEPILKAIKLVKLSNPNRAFFDIDSAVLTAPPQNWFFNNGSLKQVKIGQFSTNPNKIRVVMYFEEGFNPQKVSFLKINNNLVIKLKDGLNGLCKDEYFQNTYSEDEPSAHNFYEKLAITSEDISKVQIAVNKPKADPVLNEIQQAFNASTAPSSDLKQTSAKTTEVLKRDLKLNSKYYINGISIRPNGVLINGFGKIGVEKPMYLTAPARVVFNIPNALVSNELKNKEFKINEKETVKIGQFTQNIARVVVTSDSLEKYIPIFPADGQSLLIANQEKIDSTTLFTKPTDAVSYLYKNINPQTDEFIIAFNSPVIHCIKRDTSKLTVYFYNALRYNDETFKNSIKSTSLGDMKIDLLPKIGLKLTLPLKKDNIINCDLGSDAKSIKITIKGTKNRVIEARAITPQKLIVFKNEMGNGEQVVLDPGHGGVDYGAIRAGINEKDITLDVTKRVEAILVSKGVKVAMTRDMDETVSLQDRTTLTENKHPNLFVSIHVNSCTGTGPCGVETHYYHPESIELAKTVHSSLVSYIKSPDRGLFKSKFYVINHTTAPAILVEIGFISNDHERAELVSEQRKQQTARAIAEGVLRYLNNK